MHAKNRRRYARRSVSWGMKRIHATFRNRLVPILSGISWAMHSWPSRGGQVTTMDGQTNDVGRWDMIIAFPPCTKTSNAGARHLYKGGRLNLVRYYDGLCGKALFLAIWAADCDKVVIENPTPSKIFDYPEPTQVIQPYQFGHPFTKKTLLWERGVQPLEPSCIVKPTATWCPSGSYSHKHGQQHKGMFTTDRAKNRAKTFPGIARAMAEQWGGQCDG